MDDTTLFTCSVPPGWTGNAPASWLTVRQALANAVYPVGSIYQNASDPTNPATLFGVGTWEALGAGRVLVALGAAPFNVIGGEVGAETVTLDTTMIPAHTHVQNAHGHTVNDAGHTHLTQRYPTATGASSGFTIDTSMSGTLADNTLPTKSATTGLTVNTATATNQNTGGGLPHSNLQPSITVYRWVRTA